MAVISTASIWLTAIKGLVRCSDYPFLRLVPVPFVSCCHPHAITAWVLSRLLMRIRL